MLTAMILCLLALGFGPEAATAGDSGSDRIPRAVAMQTEWFDCGDNGDCAEGEFCRYPQGECGGDGTCTLLPDVCGMGYKPVCGCDGQTYMNRCEAFSEGVSIDYPGDC